MAVGDLTASTPTLCDGLAAVKTHIDTLNLAATTDEVKVIPIPESPNQFMVFKIERAAS